MVEIHQKPYLSKSRLVSAWQCLKKIHLEKNKPDLAEQRPGVESIFAMGHAVGDMAKHLYGDSASVEIEYSKDLSQAVRQTRELISLNNDSPIFEATFEFDGVLVRVDVLIPEPGGWRAIEVKASTSVKEVHCIDCAIQYWVMKQCGLLIKSIALGYVDNQFIYEGDGNYSGLLAEEDLTEEVKLMEADVVRLIENARQAIEGEVPAIPVGQHCFTPYDCDFEAYCWSSHSEFPVMGLKGAKKNLAKWVNEGYTDIRDVPTGEITAAKQRRIYEATKAGVAEVRQEGRSELKALPYPRYHLDFETVAPAVPVWTGTRPYQTVPFQFSIHIDDGSHNGIADSMLHRAFLDLSGDAPMRPLAERLIEYLGDAGPVLMYTTYEKTVIEGLIKLFPDLKDPLQAIIERLFDLYPVVRDNYYHPAMQGSWSIKSVLPAIVPHMQYGDLEGIQEGMGASEGYLEAISPGVVASRKAELEEQLLHYCKFDTEAMVEIVRFFEFQ